jgi:DNA invertase Pin-like site-specific DNA recombinase
MTVYSYARVSTERQAEEGVSLDEQQRRIDGQALMEGWTIGRRFIETGISGSIALGERPEGAKLLALLKPGDIVVAAKLDRMFRSALDALTVIKEFQRRGISLWLLDVGGDVSGNGIAKLMLTIVSAFAEFERDRISERIRDAKRQMRAEGRLQGGKRPFGWRVGDDRTLIEDPVEQTAISEMRLLREGGSSYRAISQTLAERGIAVDHTTVRKILQRQWLAVG